MFSLIQKRAIIIIIIVSQYTKGNTYLVVTTSTCTACINIKEKYHIHTMLKDSSTTTKLTDLLHFKYIILLVYYRC